jgi:type IV pilus assembly protein PilC
MAEFICRLGTPAGEVVTRTVEATGVHEARARLEREGFRVFNVTPPKTSGVASLTRFGRAGAHPRVKANDFLLFNQQLAALVRAGIPILQAITMLRKRAASARLRAVLGDVEEQIRGGAALSQAFAAQGGIFPRIYTASILAGERSGNLDDVLRRYVEYTKALAQLRRKIRGALTYPIILLCSAFILISILTTFVIPQFSLLYDNIGGELPPITRFVVAVSSGVKENIYWLLPALLIAGASIYSWRKTENGRRSMDRWVLKIPVVGELIKQLTMAQFSRSMGTLLRGGITVVESFQIALQSISNRELLRSTEPALSKIREGKPFTESLAGAGWAPELATDMMGVGERSGSLREMLDEVAGFYDAETETKLGQLTSVIEPAILLMMAGVVITILLAIYLPLLQMVSKVGA